MWKTVVIHLIRVNPLWLHKFFFISRIFMLCAYFLYFFLRIAYLSDARFFLKKLRIAYFLQFFPRIAYFTLSVYFLTIVTFRHLFIEG